MAKNEAENAAMSPESIACLADVKKGKPRKFAIICKGPAVVSLVIYKKGNVEKRKKEAKEAGKGQFYFGVVDGQGVDIRFALCRTDGFESAPVKNVALKEFIEVSADFKCKPHFEIVDVSPLALDEDDPLAAEYMALHPTAMQSAQNHPEQASQIHTLCSSIASLLDQEQSDQASQQLQLLKELLQGLAPGTSETQPDSNSNPQSKDAPGPDPDDSLKTRLSEALKKLKPLLVSVIERQPAQKPSLMERVTAASDQLKNDRLEEAQVSIVALGKLLKELSNSGTSTQQASPATDQENHRPANQDAVLGRLKELAPSIKTALGGARGPQIKALVDSIRELVAASNFTQAAEVVGQLQAALAGSGISLMALSKARLQWHTVRLRAISELRRLQDILRAEYDGDNEVEKSVDQAIDRLNACIDSLSGGLEDCLDDVLNTGATSQTITSAKNMIAHFESVLRDDAVLAALDGNEYAPDMRVASPMRIQLQVISAALE